MKKKTLKCPRCRCRAGFLAVVREGELCVSIRKGPKSLLVTQPKHIVDPGWRCPKCSEEFGFKVLMDPVFAMITELANTP